MREITAYAIPEGTQPLLVSATSITILLPCNLRTSPRFVSSTKLADTAVVCERLVTACAIPEGTNRTSPAHSSASQRCRCPQPVSPPSCTYGLAQEEQARAGVNSRLTFTRHSFGSRPLYKNQCYYSQTPPSRGHPTRPLHRPHRCAI